MNTGKPMSAVEEMQAEFVGGPFDGEHVILRVVRESATEQRVLSWRYTRKAVLDSTRPTAL